MAELSTRQTKPETPGQAFIQNLRRGHCELGTYALRHLIVPAAFDELTPVL